MQRIRPCGFFGFAICLAPFLLLFCCSVTGHGLAQTETHSFSVGHGTFLLNGQPYQILSGEMHYARIPRAYWRARLRMAKAMGLNTISTYVFWNLHEPRPGAYDFSGNLDVAEFIRMAQQEGLHVILRPGPYVCAEWDLGGYPPWLFADPRMVLRSDDPSFMVPAERWMMRLGRELAPLQIGNGGPIVAVQLENEYGSFGSNKIYLRHMRKILLRAGFTSALMYTADGADNLSKGTLPGVLAVANFGPGDAADSFAKLAKFEPGQPLMSGEFWAGWFDHWGGKHAVTNEAQVAREYAWMLDHGYSVNLYMFHGGTSFGFMNGANIDAATYEPDVTSYDYNAPLDESGRPTKLYYTLRDIIARHTGGKPSESVPASPAPIHIPAFSLTQSVSLWKALPHPTSVSQPLPMERIGQSYGYILYRTEIMGPVHGELALNKLHDYAQIYLNGNLVGTLDRRLHQNRLMLNSSAEKTQLDILVENSGRVNFTRSIRTERQGITESVTLGGNPLSGWKIYPLPMEHPDQFHFQTHSNGKPALRDGPNFYQGRFFLTTPGDTFLDMRSMRKGVVWINGHILGRFWDVGPQQTLYVPGPWLQSGWNSVIAFDLIGQPGAQLQGLDSPILNAGMHAGDSNR